MCKEGQVRDPRTTSLERKVGWVLGSPFPGPLGTTVRTRGGGLCNSHDHPDLGGATRS